MQNTKNMEKFLKDNGVKPEVMYVEVMLDPKQPAHENGAIPLAMMILAKVSNTLQIKPWVDLTKIKF